MLNTKLNTVYVSQYFYESTVLLREIFMSVKTKLTQPDRLEPISEKRFFCSENHT